VGLNKPQIWGVLGQFFLLLIEFRNIFGFVPYLVPLNISLLLSYSTLNTALPLINHRQIMYELCMGADRNFFSQTGWGSARKEAKK
jgi:CTP-dependent riboflavin kinase